ASTWALHQKYTGRRKRVLQNADGSLAPQTNDYLNVPNDDPDPTFRQQTAGQPLFFWIDGPGHSKFVSGKQVSSLTQVQNFTSWAQKGRLVCRTTWYLKLVVQNGSIVQQAFGPGRASTNF